MDMNDVKRLFISDSDLTGYYIALRSTDGTLLYTDLPEQEKDFVTLTKQLSNGNLNITVYIADQIFYQKIQPMLHFLFIYGIVCAIVLILVIATGTHISVRPIQNITRAPNAVKTYRNSARHRMTIITAIRLPNFTAVLPISQSGSSVPIMLWNNILTP